MATARNESWHPAEKMSLGLTFMTYFLLANGIVVLVMMLGHQLYLRQNDFSLLKILGMNAWTRGSILIWEFILLGFLSASLGSLLGTGLVLALSHFLFDQFWDLSLEIPLMIIGIISGICLLISLVANQILSRQSPQNLHT